MLSPSKYLPKLPRKTLALTYDDGPGPWTLELAEFLHAMNIGATFFVVGDQIRRYPGVIQQVAKLGHLIANHTNTHPSLPSLVVSPEALRHEILATHRLIEDVVEDSPLFLRAPWGNWSPEVAEILNADKILQRYIGHVHWNIDGSDYAIGSRRKEGWHKRVYTLDKCRNSYFDQMINEPQRGVAVFHDFSRVEEARKSAKRQHKNRVLELTKVLLPQLEEFRFVGLDEVV